MNLKVFKKIAFLLFLFLSIYFVSGNSFYQYIAHYADQYGWRTKLTIQNGGATDVHVYLYFYNNDGSEVTESDWVIPAYGFKTDYVENFFDYEDLPETGSIKIYSNESGYYSNISSIILFEYNGDANGPGMGGLQAAKVPSRVLNFPWFENSDNYTTGIAILNVENHDICVTMKALSNDGTVVYSSPLILGPMQRVIGFPSDFFTNPLEGDVPDMATLQVIGTGKIVGFIIMYDENINKVEAINGEPNNKMAFQCFDYKRTYCVGGDELGNSSSRGILFSRDYNKVFVDVRSKGIYVFDRMKISGGTLIDGVCSSGGGFQGRMAISADGRTLYVANASTDKIYKVSVKTGEVSEFYDLENAFAVATSNDSRYMAFGTWDGKIVFLKKVYLSGFPIWQKQSEYTVSGGRIWDVAYSDDSDYLIALDYSLHKAYCFTSSGGYLRDISFNSQFCPKRVKYFGNWFWVSGWGENKIYRIAGDLSSLYDTIDVPISHLSDFDFTPNGEYLLGLNGEIGKLVKLNLLTGEWETLDKDVKSYSIAISPDGVAYFADENHFGYFY